MHVFQNRKKIELKDEPNDKAIDIPEIRKSNRPKSTQESAEAFYLNLCNLATLAHAISGGIESPLQFCIQVSKLFHIKTTVCNYLY